MKVIISPAKKMNRVTDILDWTALPAFLPETEVLLEWLRQRSFQELQAIWNCNDQIAELNFQRLQQMDLRYQLTPAVLSYEGLQYQHMGPQVMEYSQLSWIQEHLRILSGFYGVLRPMDGIVPYRLEMQSRLPGFETESLYDYWGSRLYDALAEEELDAAATEAAEELGPIAAGIAEDTGCILNLASKEYSRCITRYAGGPKDPARGEAGRTRTGLKIVTCVFGQIIDGRVKEKGTLAKMARGDMVRWMSACDVRKVSEVKDFAGLGYRFREDLSDEKNYVFLKP